MLPICTEEQKKIIKSLKRKNVVIDAVAGSGKTTTILKIAQKYNKSNILLITYNARLKLETRKKAEQNDIENVEIHSYHSFCYRYYDNRSINDKGIRKYVINRNIKCNFDETYDIILDEAQDISELYYRLVLKIYKDNKNKNAKLCIFGDKNQCIFQFNSADERYIIYANLIYNLNECKWKKRNLSESFRITIPMAKFINKCVLNESRMKSNKKSNYKPRYVVCNCFEDETRYNLSIPFNILKEYLSKGYEPSDIFILAPSVRGTTNPIKILESLIIENLKNIQVYIPTSDEEKLDDKVINNKLVFSSFHQVKGLERKVIIVFNFDNSYFKYYEKNNKTTICPNVFYVAITRAKEHLVLLHHCDNDFFDFVNKSQLKYYTDYEEYTRYGKTMYDERKSILYKKFDKNKSNNNHYGTKSPTELVRHLNEKIVSECLKFVKIINIGRNNNDIISIDTKSHQKYNDTQDGYENVSEITGIAIPLYYEYKINGNINDALYSISYLEEKHRD